MSLSRPLFSFTNSAYPAASIGSQRQVAETIAHRFELGQEVDQFISSRYAPVFVLVNDQMHILHLRGDTDRYLKLPFGTTDLNLLLMAREGLEIPLRTATYQAQTQNMAVREEQIQIESDAQWSPTDRRSTTYLNLEVIPFQPTVSNGLYFLVIFEAVSPVTLPTATPSDRPAPEALAREIVQLRQALAAATQRELSAQAHLQAVIQEQGFLNQNLRVANEEILSSNEELQSTNEELQTAKEEIQATNEELSTTNDELRSRNSQQSRNSSDINNFVDSISIPILMLTNDLRIRRFTLAAQRLFNFLPTDVGRPFNDFRTDFDVASLEAMALEVLETLNTKDEEIQTQSGYWYGLRIRPYRTAENQIDGVTIAFLDIDALKRHAATLELARNYAEAIVETVQVPLLVLDADLRVNTANQAFCETFQVSGAETEQTLVFELGNGQWDIPQLRSLLEEVVTSSGQVQNFEVDHYFEQIGQKTMLLNACKLQQDGDVTLILLAILDITERQQFEAERSQLLAQEQSARQLAETANRAKDVFLSNLSHELRNPLSAIMGWAQMLRTSTLDAAMVDYALEVIERNARVQSQLIEDILDVSRIISGKLDLSTSLLDLSWVIRAAIETVQLSAEAKNIRIISQLTAAHVMGDVDRLQQVLGNLLSNAIKFTPPDGRVEITLEAIQGEAQIRVTDTGQGISADLLPYIFERFRQGDSSTTKPKAGLGLGLSIVKHLVELHGGTIEAASPGAGQGATLTVRLPLQESPPELLLLGDLPTALATAGDDSSQPVLSLAGLRILVVDDEADTRDLFKFVLEGYGAEVLTVSSARAALAALTEAPHRYDVLVSDIGMPGEDGYWLIRQVRSLSAEAGGQTPAVALTAYAGEVNQQQAIEAGFQIHLAKPVAPVQLALLVADLAAPDRRSRP